MGLWYAGHQRNKEKTYPEAGKTKIKAPLNSSGHKIHSPRDHGDNGHVEGYITAIAESGFVHFRSGDCGETAQ